MKRLELWIFIAGAMFATYNNAMQKQLPQQVKQIHRAIVSGNYNRVTNLLHDNVAFTRRNHLGDLPIHTATKHNQKRITQLFIDHNIDINTQDKDGDTPIHLAVRNNNLDFVQFYINNNADLNIADKDNHTPLYSAILHENIDTAQSLLNNGASVNIRNKLDATPLYVAIAKGNAAITQLLINHDASLYNIDKYNNSALHIAVFNNNTDIAQQLIDNGIDINTTNIHLVTPLFHAVFRNCLPMAKILINNNADTNIANQQRTTPLDVAVNYKYEKIVPMLAANHAHISYNNNMFHETPLHKAAENSFNNIQCFIAYGADTDVQNRHGHKPKHVAQIIWGQKKTEKLFDPILPLLHNNQIDKVIDGTTPYDDIVMFAVMALGQRYYNTAQQIAQEKANNYARGNILLHGHILYALYPHNKQLDSWIGQFNNLYDDHDHKQIINSMLYTTGQHIQQATISYEAVSHIIQTYRNRIMRYRDKDNNTFLHYIAIGPRYTDFISDIQPKLIQNAQNKDMRNNANQTPDMIARKHNNERFAQLYTIYKDPKIPYRKIQQR